MSKCRRFTPCQPLRSCPIIRRKWEIVLLACTILLLEFFAGLASAQSPVFINEILADPDGTNGDANGDGVVSGTQDEFVELVNVSGSFLDISGWTLSDASGVRHTYPPGSVVCEEGVMVVFSGGTPTGSFG